MKNQFLFAIDTTTEEIIVSESPKGSFRIQQIDRIPCSKHKIFANAVKTLEAITQSAPMDTELFKDMDKICQTIYNKYKTEAPAVDHKA